MKLVFGIGQHVEDLHRASLEQRPTHGGATLGLEGDSGDDPAELVGDVGAEGARTKISIRLAQDVALVRMGQPDRAVEDRLKDGIELEARTADRLQHLPHRRLALQRLVRLAEQAGEPDRDRRLVREGLDDSDLRRRERAWLIAGEGDDANRLAVPQHRHRHDGPHAGDSLHLEERVFRIVQDVGDMDHATIEQHAPRGGAAFRHVGERPFHALVLLGVLVEPGERDHAEDVTVAAGEVAGLGMTQPHRMLGNDLQDRIEVEARERDRLQDILHRRLALRGLMLFGEQACQPDRDRRMIGEDRHEADLLVVEWGDDRSGKTDHADEIAAVTVHRRP